ncbi:hypothetical protein V6N12_050257 [Hibiscus sabdariffa]|uniref:Uncharacterized protein n=1 Tax=Hibiscus sabdariffa TaxID=183260 RepID=A0ABR2GBV0_9ROSI
MQDPIVVSDAMGTEGEHLKIGTPIEVIHLSQVQKQVLATGQDGSRPSYANIVNSTLRGTIRDQNGLEDSECDPNKILVSDEDCVIDRTRKFPRIEFSESVHKQIDLAMRNESCGGMEGKNTDPKEGMVNTVDGRGSKEGATEERVLVNSVSNHLSDVPMEVNMSITKNATHLASNMEKEVRENCRIPVGVKEMQRSYFWRKGHGRTTSDGFSFGEESGGKRGGKEGLQQGLKVRKPPDTRTISWPVLTEWVDGVNVQLNATASSSVHDPGGFVRAIVNQDGIQCLNTSPCYNNENIL